MLLPRKHRMSSTKKLEKQWGKAADVVMKRDFNTAVGSAINHLTQVFMSKGCYLYKCN